MLEIDGLTATVGGKRLLAGVSLRLQPGEVVALLGASGSGKSLTGRAVLALPPRGVRYGGAVLLGGTNLLATSERQLRALRGPSLSMVFQEPATALNPVKRIGTQMAEPFAIHTGLDRRERAEKVTQLLEDTGLTSAGVSPERYPHELSGGQRQRVALAIAVALEPKVIVADEPTSALDSVAADRVLNLLFDLTQRAQTSLILITHDVEVARRAHRIAVMANGEIAEAGPTHTLLSAARSPEARALLRARAFPLPGASVGDGKPAKTAPFLRVNELRAGRGGKTIVSGAAFSVARGERLAIVGRSGSGKTSLMRAVLGLLPSRADITLDGHAVTPGANILRRSLAMVFQDPATSFNPRHRIWQIVTEPLYREGLSRTIRRAKAEALLAQVDMAGVLDERPHRFSGGQRQRIAIARALIGAPEVLIADEAVSALDAQLRAEVIGLLDRLVRDHQIALIFITHDLRLVRHLADRMLVMDAGKVVEEGPPEMLFASAKHPATKALLAAVDSGAHKPETAV